MSQYVTIEDFTSGAYQLPRDNFEHGADELFQVFVDEAEVETLRKILGIELYDELKVQTYLPDLKWTKLADGAIYTLYEKKYIYKGLRAILIPYIYSLRTIEQYDAQLTTGVQEANVENAIKISPKYRIARAQSKACHAYGCYYSNYNSLRGFISSAPEDYPTFVYNKDFTPSNRFGL